MKKIKGFWAGLIFVIIAGLFFEFVEDENIQYVEESQNQEINVNEIPEYVRDDWENPGKNRFYDPIRDKYVGMKNYMLYKDTNMDITSDNFSYVCWYCDNTIDDYQKVEWDHIIPLYYVHCNGGAYWSNEQKEDYCYSQDVGINVCRSCNRIKSAKGPSEWLPEIHQKEYCEKWIEISEQYDIHILDGDMEVINKVLKEQ